MAIPTTSSSWKGMTTHCLIFQNKFFLFNPPQAIFILIQAFCNIYSLSQALFLYLPHPTLNFKFHLTLAPFITVYSLFPLVGFWLLPPIISQQLPFFELLLFHFSPFPIPFSHFSLHLTTLYLRKIIGNMMIHHIPCLLKQSCKWKCFRSLRLQQFCKGANYTTPVTKHAKKHAMQIFILPAIKVNFLALERHCFVLFTVLATGPVKSINCTALRHCFDALWLRFPIKSLIKQLTWFNSIYVPTFILDWQEKTVLGVKVKQLQLHFTTLKLNWKGNRI